MSKDKKRREPEERPARRGRKRHKGRLEPRPQETPECGGRGILDPILFVLLGVFSLVFIFISTHTATDFDGFYHLGHAAQYAQNGPFMREFPWVVYSVVRLYGADIWYGFHLLLIPFTWIGDAVLRVRLTAAAMPAFLLVALYIVMRRHKIPYAFVWPYLLLFSAWVTMWRLDIVRPHVVSVGLAALLLSFVVRGRAWQVALVAAALSFVHLSFFWLGIFIGLVEAAVRWRTERVSEINKLAAIVGGLALGWLLRPNPLGAAKILNVQIFELMAQKQQGLVAFGPELAPAAPGLLEPFTIFIAIWAGAAGFFLLASMMRRVEAGPEERVLLWSSLVLSVVFFGMITMVSKRSVDQWLVFATIVTAASLGLLADPRKGEAERWPARSVRAGLWAAGGIAAVIMAWVALADFPGNIKQGLPIERFRPAAEWLQANSEPQDIVFHTYVDVFPELFYWNPKNYYIGGMDSIFQFAYDKELYWKTHHLNRGATAFSWGTPETRPQVGEVEPTYKIIADDFGARYVLLQVRFMPTRPLLAYLESDRRFAKRFQDDHAAVFEVVGQKEQ